MHGGTELWEEKPDKKTSRQEVGAAPDSEADVPRLSFAFQTFMLSFLNYAIAIWTANHWWLKLLGFPVLSSDSSRFRERLRSVREKLQFLNAYRK